jgi:hypothetical protein
MHIVFPLFFTGTGTGRGVPTPKKNKGQTKNQGKKRLTGFPFFGVGYARRLWAWHPTSRGRQKKIDGPPRTFAKYQTHPPIIRLLFFLTFFFSTFLGVSRQGEFKNTIKIFLQKVHVENFFQNLDKIFDVSFSSTFFVLSRFRVFLSDGSSKPLQKTFCKKNRVEKFLQKNRPKIQNRLFLEFFLSRFWAFLDEGSSKTRLKNIDKINLALVLFRTLTHPPTTGVTDFFLAGPLPHLGTRSWLWDLSLRASSL